MNSLVDLMKLDEHCPECGALLNGQNACGHCDFESDREPHGATVIALPPEAQWEATADKQHIA